MEIQEISRADILDILFEGRNKDYGAYQLRKTYNRRLTKALAGMASVCLLLIGGYTLAGKSHASKIKPPEMTETTLIDPLKEEPVIPPKPIPVPQQQIASIKNTIPRIVPPDQVKPDDVPPTEDKLNDDVKIATINQKGDAFDGTVAPPPVSGAGQGVIEGPKRNDAEDESIHMFVEIESKYPAGMDAWIRFLSKNYHIPDEAIATETGGTVIVQFVVDKEGNVSDVKAIEGPEVLREEAVRVIKKSGKWTPAIQNGRKVNSYKRQPIVVKVENE